MPASPGGAPKLLADRDSRRCVRRGGRMINGDTILDVGGLNVGYGETKVLFHVSIVVHPGEVVACVGRNGAGKTTLLRSIAGFLKPHPGRYARTEPASWARPRMASPAWASSTFPRTRRCSPT